MRSFVLIFKLLLFYELSAQISWSEAFENQNSTFMMKWQGDTAVFSASDSVLHLNAPGAGDYFIYRSSTIGLEAVWKGGVHLEFNPSSSNFAEVLLMVSDTGLSKTGYGLRFGGTSDDKVSLIRYKGTNYAEIVSTSSGFLNYNDNVLHYTVMRNDSTWKLYLNDSLIGVNCDGAFWNSNYFGLSTTVTTTRKDKVHFLPIEVVGLEFEDVKSPSIVQVLPMALNKLQLVFDEVINFSDSASITFLHTSGIAASYRLIEPQKLEVIIGGDISGIPKMKWNIQGFQDDFKNVIDTTLEVVNPFFKRDQLFISEIMYDPTPSYGLPENEYLELFNNDFEALDLNGWTLEINSNSYDLPDSIIEPGAVWVLSNLGLDGGIGMHWGESALPNSGGELKVFDQWSRLIERVHYYPEWHTTPEALNGGISLELFSTDMRCLGKQVWKSSSQLLGGSPGEVQMSTISQPMIQLDKVEYDDPFWRMTFNISLDSCWLNWPENDLEVRKMRLEDNRVEFDLSFLSESTFLTINVASCIGFFDTSIVVGEPLNPEAGELRMTEVLFNSFPNEPRYIEVMNLSNHVLALNSLKFTSVYLTIFDTSSIWLTKEILAPNEVIFLSENPGRIRDQYPVHGRGLDVELPKMSDEGVELSILNVQGKLVDKVKVNESFHHIGIAEKEGRALELKSLEMDGLETANWRSVTDHFLGGTPGVWEELEFGEATDEVHWRNARFSPNADGINDDMRFVISKETRALFEVFDHWGQPIWSMDYGLVQPNFEYTWDGRNTTGQPIYPGYYFCVLTLMDESGQMKKYRSAILVTQD